MSDIRQHIVTILNGFKNTN